MDSEGKVVAHWQLITLYHFASGRWEEGELAGIKDPRKPEPSSTRPTRQ